MLDVIVMAIGLAFFALSVGYAYALKDCEEGLMVFDYALAALVTAGLLFYLTYALLRPERF